MDWSYIAGYFDGEGTAWSRAHGTGSVKCSLRWFNSDLPSLEAMQVFMGCGRVRARSLPKPGYKQMYVLVIEDQRSLVQVVPELLARCIVKQEALLLLAERLKTLRPQSAGVGSLKKAGPVEIERLYASGWTQKRIGQKFGVTQGAVRKYMSLNGIAARPLSEALRMADRTSLTWLARNAKVAEQRRREWADPVMRERRITALKAGKARAREHRASLA